MRTASNSIHSSSRGEEAHPYFAKGIRGELARMFHAFFHGTGALSLTPCFSGVKSKQLTVGTVSTVSTRRSKPLKRFWPSWTPNTQPKQGVNERAVEFAGRVREYFALEPPDVGCYEGGVFSEVLCLKAGLLICSLIFFASIGLNAADKSEAEVRALIKRIGPTPPDWFQATPLRYPKTLDMSWKETPGAPWDPSKNVGQFIWTTINENESRWKEGIRFLHYFLVLNEKNPELSKKTMRALAHMYHNLHQDWARAAFWWEQAGETDNTDLAHCYFKLGSKAMATRILKDYDYDDSRHCNVARLWSEMGENDKGLKMALETADEFPDVGFLAAGDICRVMGRSKDALGYYQKVLATPSGGRDLKQAKERAQASLDAVKLVDALDVKRIPGGIYRDSSVGYSGQVFVEVSVASGRIADVKVTQHTEKQWYSSITDTRRQILLKQGAKGVDATSGATITSEAILNATLKALAKGQK